jgi:hypothetical protein
VGAGAVALVCVLTVFFFADALVNGLVKSRMTAAFNRAYPAYQMRIGHMAYSADNDRLTCDSIAVNSVDEEFFCTVGRASIEKVHWIHLLRGGTFDPAIFLNSTILVHDVRAEFHAERYEARASLVRISLPDSLLVCEECECTPSGDDEEWFAGSPVRATRFRVHLPRVTARGVAWAEGLKGTRKRIRYVSIEAPVVDVLMNKDKPVARDTSSPPMPVEFLSSLQGLLQVDSVSITGGRLQYAERFAVRGKPAVISFDSMGVCITGISNQVDTAAAMIVVGEGTFMRCARMSMRMVFPVASPDFSFQYSGSVTRMDIRTLNAFLETAEQLRIKRGTLQAASFSINVVDGHAGGNVHAVYKDLTFALINKFTGSEKGLSDGIKSFIANTFTIRGTNIPNKKGVLAIGQVQYVRKRDDPFFRFVWFALRSGLKDVVGF